MFKDKDKSNCILFLISTILFPLFFCGCTKDKEIEIEKDRYYEIVWSISKTHPKGFVFDLKTQTFPQEGIAVAYEATQNSFGYEGMKRVVDFAQIHTNIVGGWLNKVDGYYYFDCDTLFNEFDIEKAKVFAKKNNQLAIFKISTSEEIKIEY